MYTDYVPGSHSWLVHVPLYDRYPIYWRSFCFLRSSICGPGVMSAFEVETIGEDESRAAKLPKTSVKPIVNCASIIHKGLRRNREYNKGL
jgi:hypothetical protein